MISKLSPKKEKLDEINNLVKNKEIDFLSYVHNIDKYHGIANGTDDFNKQTHEFGIGHQSKNMFDFSDKNISRSAYTPDQSQLHPTSMEEDPMLQIQNK